MCIQVDKKHKNKTRHVRIDVGLHRLIKIEAARHQTSLRDIVEACIGDSLKEVLEVLDEQDKKGIKKTSK